MAAAGPIIHCVIATRVFRSVYCLQRKQQHQQRMFSRALQLLFLALKLYCSCPTK